MRDFLSTLDFFRSPKTLITIVMQYAVKNNDTKSIIYYALGVIIESLEINFPMVL